VKGWVGGPAGELGVRPHTPNAFSWAGHFMDMKRIRWSLHGMDGVGCTLKLTTVILIGLCCGCSKGQQAGAQVPQVSTAPEPGAESQALSIHDQLVVAAGSGDTASVVGLLDQGARIEHVAKGGEPWRLQGTPLMAAAVNGHEVVVQTLLARGADARYGDTLLWTMEYMGWTTKRRAVYARIASALIDKGADVNAVAEWESSQDRYTALSRAAEYGNVPLVRKLIAKGANVNRGYPLWRAKENGHTEVVRILKRAGAREDRDE